MERLKLLVVDDHPIVRKGVVGALGGDETVEVVGEAEGIADAIRMANALEPDAVLMDFHMRTVNCLEAGRIIQDMFPEMKVVFLADKPEDIRSSGYRQSLKGDSYVKEAKAGALSGAIRSFGNPADRKSNTGARVEVFRSCSGSRYNGEGEGPFFRLSPAEKRVLDLVMQGYSNKSISESLFVSVNTVKAHIRNIFRKLNVRSRTQAMSYALRYGLTEAE